MIASSRPSASTTGLPEEPRASGAVCSRLPVMRRPRGPRKLRSTPLTMPWVMRAPPSAVRPTANTTSPGSAGVVGPRQGGRAGGVDLEHDEVAVGVDGGDAALLGATVGEGHLGGAVAEVVGVGEHVAVGHDDAAAPPGGSADADDGRGGGGEGGAGRLGEGGAVGGRHGRSSGNL